MLGLLDNTFYRNKFFHKSLQHRVCHSPDYVKLRLKRDDSNPKLQDVNQTRNAQPARIVFCGSLLSLKEKEKKILHTI